MTSPLAAISIGSLLSFAPWASDRQKRKDDMAIKRRKKTQDLPVLHPDAAGIDVGASELFVAVPADRDSEPVRSYPTFTRDLHELADWLQSCGIRSMAMESTSVYWIPVYQILEARGIEVFLVNAHYLKNVPGRKSDVTDCQWIQYLHSAPPPALSSRPSPDPVSTRFRSAMSSALRS